MWKLLLIKACTCWVQHGFALVCELSCKCSVRTKVRTFAQGVQKKEAGLWIPIHQLEASNVKTRRDLLSFLLGRGLVIPCLSERNIKLQ